MSPPTVLRAGVSCLCRPASRYRPPCPADRRPAALLAGSSTASRSSSPPPAAVTPGPSIRCRPGTARIFQLSCPTTTACGALATPSATLPLGQQYYGRVRFLAITDNGRHFAASAVVRGDSMQYLSCPTASHCVAIGVHNRDAGLNQPLGPGVVATSTDGGTTWSSGVLP